MSLRPEPEFLSRSIIDAIHDDQIYTYGGLPGLRNENGLESAIAAAQNVYYYGYYYGEGDIYDVAAAYAYHITQSQAYFDGNKRTAAQAAFVFLEGCGIDCSRLPNEQTYDAMISIATHNLSRSGLAEYFRFTLSRK